MAKNNKANYGELLIISGILIVTIFLWNTPFNYPLKLFVVLLHESSHAIAALLTGGSIGEIDLDFNLGGKISTSGGSELIIASAGYLGSLMLGLMLFAAAGIKNRGRWIIVVLIGIILPPLFYGEPSASFFIISISASIFLALCAFYINYKIATLVIKVIALSSCMYVIYDLKSDMFSDEMIMNDAAVISNLLGIHSTAVAIAAFILSVSLIFVILKKNYIR